MLQDLSAEGLSFLHRNFITFICVSVEGIWVCVYVCVYTSTTADLQGLWQAICGSFSLSFCRVDPQIFLQALLPAEPSPLYIF